MKIKALTVQNFKALYNVHTPLSEFCCVIGENNTGKSSLLQAVLLFVKGTKITSQDYFNPSSDISIKAELEGVTDAEISALAEEHRAKIRELVHDGEVTLVRRYSPDGSSKLMAVGKVVKDKRFSEENVSELLKGKTGADVENLLKEHFPEVVGSGGIATQKAARELIASYSSSLPHEDAERPLPTGIENSVKAMLPEPIYIPAVKDILDDIKTKESASFGKLLSILLNVIEPKLNAAKETFDNLNLQLNRIIDKDGNVSDHRIEEVVQIEEAIQRHVEETFPNVSVNVEIPPPEVKTILTNARIQVNDGVMGPVESKGDGFKRTITFAIMRSYLELSRRAGWQKQPAQAKATPSKYLFLFEEPELYLHPRSQKILYNALAKISENHQVVLSTHSPLFFSHQAMGTFIKMTKRPADQEKKKPFAEALPIGISDMNCRDQLQIISFETSNVAFFMKAVVLVEGDSDSIVFPHLSKIFNEGWDFENGAIAVVKVNGKGSFRRYRDFFRRFEMAVFIITDLDSLIKDFDKLEADEEAKQSRNELLQLVDGAIAQAETTPGQQLRLLKEASKDAKQKALFQTMTDRRKQFVDGKCTAEELAVAVAALFEFEKEEPRLKLLQDDSNQEIRDHKRGLIAKLRTQGVFVLEKGDIESYYPDGVTGADKPSKAQSLCRLVQTQAEACALCDWVPVPGESQSRPEFEIIFGVIFNSLGPRESDSVETQTSGLGRVDA